MSYLPRVTAYCTWPIMHMNLVMRSSLASSELSAQDDNFDPKGISLGEGFHQGTSDGRSLESWRYTF